MSDISRLIQSLPRLQARISCHKKYLAIQGSLRLIRSLERTSDEKEAQKAVAKEVMIMMRWFRREDVIWRNKLDG